MESTGISFCVTPLIFSHFLMAPTSHPVLNLLGKLAVLTDRTRNPTGAPQPCLLDALNVAKFDVSNLGGRSSRLLSDICWFLVFWVSPKETTWKHKKIPTKIGCRGWVRILIWICREKKQKTSELQPEVECTFFINPGPYPSFEENTFGIWIRDVKFMKMLRPHLGLTSFCWSAMLFWTQIS